MTCRLTIGITCNHPAWRTLLEQIGIAVELVANPTLLDPLLYSTVIVTSPVGEAMVQGLAEHVRAGGCVLDAGNVLASLDAKKITSRSRPVIVPSSDDNLFDGVWMIDAPGSMRAHRDAEHLDGLVHLVELGDGMIAHFPLPVARLIADVSSLRRQFYSGSQRYPNETVARVTKGEIRRCVAALLQRLHAHRGLPFVHRPWTPKGGSMCYRIDSDYGSQQQIDALRTAAHDAGGKLTWFLHVGAHAGVLDSFHRFDGDEIASHGFRHRTFRSYDENRANIGHSVSLLRNAGFDPVGFTAPNGVWNYALGHAVEDAGMDYSSEFALAYDDLPFHPWLRNRFAQTLQLPIHPICIGSFIRAKGNPQEMTAYFRRTVELSLWRREPVMLYHHPGHAYFDVMAKSIDYARSLGAQPMTMREYAAWWRMRSAIQFQAWSDGIVIKIQSNGGIGDGIVLERDGGKEAWLTADGVSVLDDCVWQCRAVSLPERPANLRRVRRINPLLWRQSLEDFNARIRQ